MSKTPRRTEVEPHKIFFQNNQVHGRTMYVMQMGSVIESPSRTKEEKSVG